MDHLREALVDSGQEHQEFGVTGGELFGVNLPQGTVLVDRVNDGPGGRLVVESLDRDAGLFRVAVDVDPPGIAADLAVLDHFAVDVGFDEDLDLFAAVGTPDEKAFRLAKVCHEVIPNTEKAGHRPAFSDG